MQYHSLAVSGRKRWDETALHKMCNITHLLPLVIKKDVIRVIRLPFTPMYNVTHMLLIICRKKCKLMRLYFTTMWNVTHKLLMIEKGVVRQPFNSLSQNVQFHSLPVGCKRDVMRQHFTKCATSLTNYLS